MSSIGVPVGRERVFPPGQGETLERMAQAENYNRWLLDRSLPHLGRRVLDVGAGLGTFTAALAPGREVVALEPDPAFVPSLRDRFAEQPNVEVVGAGVEDFRRELPFDSAICFNVLEHIADDSGFLGSLHRLIAPAGSLLLLVPAGPALFGSLDRTVGHERRYGRRGLARRLEAAGFEPALLRYVNPLGALGWFVAGRVLRREQIPLRPLRAYDRLVPFLRTLDALTLPFGLSLWAVARRAA